MTQTGAAPRGGSGWREDVARLDPALRRTLIANALGIAGAFVTLSVAYATGFRYREVPQDIAVLGVGMLLLLLGTIALSRYGDQAAVLVLLVSTSVFAIGGTWITPYLIPVTVLLMLLPLLIGYPFLSRPVLWAVLAYAVLGSSALAAIAEWRRTMHDPDTWIVGAATVGGALPFVAAVVADAAIASYNRLRDQAEQLRESRNRVVEVALAARRSLERDLHDGAQQRLVAMSVTIGRAQQAVQAGANDQATELLAQLAEDNVEALSEMRELARGIYPPLLTERGLVVAVQSVARRSPIPVTVRAPEPFHRPHADTETAAYFCILEALQNAAKHSGASEVVVEITQDRGLEFAVRDDGRGFDPVLADGGGMLSMDARIAALEGRLEVVSAVGAGTTVRGHLPAELA